LGAVSTTTIAGILAVRKGIAKPIGSLTEMGTVRLGKRTDGRSPSIREFVALSHTFTDASAYVRAQRRRAAVMVAWEHWFRDHGVDVVLEPTTKCTAPPRGDGYASGRLGGEGDPLIELTAHWNLTGFPVAALPAGVGARSGLPVGVSLIAPRGAEAQVLQIGIDLQEHALPPLHVPKESA